MRKSLRGVSAEGGPGLTVTTRHLGGQGGLRHSLRSSGRIRKKKLLGNKFEFADKLKEKRNYILYVSGVGHETKEIEEIEEMPQPPPKEEIIEQRQIIDNYQYHETKNVKKVNPKIISITHHERLSIPLERTTLKKYSSYTSQPLKSYTKTKSIKTTRFGKETDADKFDPYNSFTSKIEKNNNIAPSTLYETYKPIKKTIVPKNERTLSTVGNYVSNSNNKYENRNIIKIGKYKNLQRPPTAPNYGKNNQVRTEAKQNGNNLIKRTFVQNKIIGGKPYQGLKTEGRASPYGGLRPKDKLSGVYTIKGGRMINSQNELRNGERSRPGSRPDRSGYRPKTGFGVPYGTFQVQKTEYLPVRRDEKPGIRTGYKPGSRKEERPINRPGDNKRSRPGEKSFDIQYKPKEPYEGSSRFIQQSKYKKVNKTIVNQFGDRGKGVKVFVPGKEQVISSYSEYKKYEQKPKLLKNPNNVSKHQLNKSSIVRQSNNYNNYNNVSNYQFNDDEFVVIDCPVHGKQTIKKSKFMKFGFN